MAATKVVVDPITRIEGHLRIEAQAENGKIAKAWSTATQFRGIETIMEGRDPRDAWAFTQRICGVCTVVHAVASCRAVEDALDIRIPANANLIRNLIHGMQFIQDHVIHFYHLHALDWVDVVSALKADPSKTSALAMSISDWPNSSATYFKGVQQKVKTLVESGQLGIFANGYWGHPAYKLPPEANLMALAHYLDALTWQREVAKLHTIVGGVPCAISVHPEHEGKGKGPHYRGGEGATSLNMVGLQNVKNIIEQMRTFVDQVYVPDTLAIAGFYKDWGAQGEGVGNFMTYGDFPEKGMSDPSSYLIPSGVILNRDLSTIHPVDLNDENQIQEYVSHSWYKYSGGKDKGLHPYAGETELSYTGPKPPYTNLDTDKDYSWLKSPRWKGKAMEVGPLARVLMLYAKGHEPTKELVGMTLNKLGVPVTALYSTLGRTAARTLETKIIADTMQTWYDQLIANIKAGDVRTFNEKKWDPSSWPSVAKGAGFMEAPRGALAHWVVIKDGKIDNYQAVVPSTWNAGPRDSQGQDGPYEAALKGHKLHDPKQPIEILRTIHSFDPCIACAVHVTDPDGEELVKVKIK